jgi:hypothetical protein
LIAGEIVDSFFMIFSLILKLVRDCIKSAAKRFHPATHGLDLIFILSQLTASLDGLFAFSFFDSTLIFLKLLIGLFFFFFQRVLHLFDLCLKF